MTILGIETKNSVYNAINDNQNISKKGSTNPLPKSIRLDDIPDINQYKISCSPIIIKPKSEAVDIANLISKLKFPLKSDSEINNQTKSDYIYILLLVNKLTADSSISDIINRGNAFNVEYMSMSRATPDESSGSNVISNVLNYLKEIAPVFNDIIRLLSFGMGTPGSIILLADVIDKIQQMVTGVSLEDKLDSDVIKPLLSYLGKEISESLVFLGVSQSTAQVISGDLAKIICAVISISTLKFSGDFIGKEVYEKVYELIKQDFMPDMDVLGLICNDVIKQVNTLLPPDISNLLQPFEQDLETAISQFGGNVIDIVFNFASQQAMDTNTIDKLLATIKNSLSSQLGNLLHQLFTTAKGDIIQLERKYITELLSNLGEEISNTLKNVLPQALWLQLQPFEASFAEFSANFVDEISDLSGQLINIIGGSVRAGHLDVNALNNAFTELEANVQGSLEKLMNAVVATTRREVLASEQKHIEELLSWAGNKITAVLQKELPEALQPLLSKMEANFSEFSANFVDEISDLSGQLINIIGGSVRAGHLDVNALNNAFTELEANVQGSLEKLMNAVVATTRREVLASEQKHIEELLSWAGNKITAVLQKELPEALQPLLSKMEANFSEFSANFVDEISDLSGQLINIIGGSVRAGHLDVNALNNAFTELEANVQGSLEKLMNAVVATTRREVLASEQKHIEELLSWAGNKITAVLQKELPEALQPLLSKMEANFSEFSANFVDEISDLSGQLINIIGGSVRAGHLDVNALNNAFTELEANVQGSLEKLMNAVVATTRREVLASEQKHIEELLSWAGNKITAVLQKELPEALQPLLSKMEANFSEFSANFVDEISDFSGQLINIIGGSVRAGHLDVNALSNAFTELKVNVQGAFDKLLKSIKGYDISVFSTLSKAPANETSCLENITFEINKSMSKVSEIIHGSILKNVLSSLERNKQGKLRTPLGLC